MAPLVRDGDVLTVHPADPGSIRLGDLVLVTASTAARWSTGSSAG